MAHFLYKENRKTVQKRQASLSSVNVNGMIMIKVLVAKHTHDLVVRMAYKINNNN